METLKLFIKKVVFFNEENGYSVLIGQTSEMIRDEKNAPKRRRDFSKKDEFSFSLTGTLEEDGDLNGTNVEVEGNWFEHKKYGKTFKFTKIKIAEDPMYFFLTKIIKGIRKETAREIVKKYNEAELQDILENNPFELTKFKGIKSASLEKIKESWGKHYILKEFSKALSPFGASISMVRRVYNQFEGDSKMAKAIAENPYLLTDTAGIGFKKADSVARAMGIQRNDPKRLVAAIEYVVEEMTENRGDTLLGKKEVFDNISTVTAFEDSTHHLQSVDTNALEQAYQQLIKNDKLVEFGNGLFTSSSLRNIEQFIYKDLLDRNKGINSQIKTPNKLEEWITQREAALGITLSEQQKDAIRKVNEGLGVFALCGYAGTGKSTISRLIIELLEELPYIDDDDCVCCALSGIAADRIRNTTGKESMTVASLLLKYEMSNGHYNKKVILIDETSMMNSSTMAQLLEAIPDDAYIILVGDPAQLPPIGAGSPFTDIINNSIVPNVELTRIYRQSENAVITTFANEIRKGILPDEIDGVYEDFSWMDYSLPNYYALKADVDNGRIDPRYFDDLKRNNRFAIQHALCDLASRKISTMREHMDNRNWSKYLKSFQIICPIKKGELGVHELNRICQQLNTGAKYDSDIRSGKNPAIVSVGDFKLFRFDKVVHIKNENFKYITVEDMRLGKDSFEKIEGLDCRINNGMIGVVSLITDKNVYVYYPTENFHVRYSHFDAATFLNLGYALTIHKTQGAEFDEVLIPMTQAHHIMLNNKLMYTAVTRAKEKLWILGEHEALKTACTNIESATRVTLLHSIASSR